MIVRKHNKYDNDGPNTTEERKDSRGLNLNVNSAGIQDSAHDTDSLKHPEIELLAGTAVATLLGVRTALRSRAATKYGDQIPVATFLIAISWSDPEEVAAYERVRNLRPMVTSALSF